jgi:hypothetical protein
MLFPCRGLLSTFGFPWAFLRCSVASCREKAAHNILTQKENFSSGAAPSLFYSDAVALVSVARSAYSEGADLYYVWAAMFVSFSQKGIVDGIAMRYSRRTSIFALVVFIKGLLVHDAPPTSSLSRIVAVIRMVQNARTNRTITARLMLSCLEFSRRSHAEERLVRKRAFRGVAKARHFKVFVKSTNDVLVVE